MSRAGTLPLMHRLNTDVTVLVKAEVLISTGRLPKIEGKYFFY